MNKRKMKFSRTFAILLSVVFLTSCNLGILSLGNSKNYDYDFAIYADDEVLTFKREDNELKLLERIPRKNEKKLGFWKELFVEHENFYFTKTTANDKNFQLLAKINKNNLDVNYYQTKGIDGAFSLVPDGKYLHISHSFVDRLEFETYDLNFNKIKTKVIPVEHSTYPNQMIVKGDKVYILIGVGLANGELKNQIWVMNKEFDLEEVIDLNYNEGGLLRMVLAGDTFYITNTNEGLTAEREPGPANKLVSYNLSTGEQKTIELETPYPLHIYFDSKRNNLIIWHYELYLPTFTYTVYSLNDGSSKIINFPEYEEFRRANPMQPPFVLFKDNYYFMFEDKLVEYSPDTNQKKEYSLKEFGMNNPTGLLGKE